MKTLKDKIEVMQAALDGKNIQRQYDEELKQWVDIAGAGAQWDWVNYDYRIKPEPMEFWVNVYDTGIAVFDSEEAARSITASINKTIKVREVVE